MIITIEDDDSSYTLDIVLQEAPTGEDWSEADKQIMTDFIGETLPFVNDKFNPWYNYYDEYIYSQSYRKEAQMMAKKAFDADASFTDVTPANAADFSYEKSISKYLKVTVTLTSSGMIKVTKAVSQLTTWESSDIATALGSDAQETLPDATAEGNKFEYTFGTNTATIKVINATASTIDAYKAALVAASFTTTDETTYKSPTDTLTVVVERVTNKTFTITATGHLPAGYSREFPVSEILKGLHNEIEEGNLPLPVGSMFFLEEVSKYDHKVTVTAEEDAKANYIAALESAEFTLTDGAYIKGNIKVAVTDATGNDFVVEFSLVEEPAASPWPDLTEVLSSIGFNKELPAPSSFTSASEPVFDDDYYCYVVTVMTDMTGAEYIEELSAAGFGTEEGYSAGDYYVYASTSYSIYDSNIEVYEIDGGFELYFWAGW